MRDILTERKLSRPQVVVVNESGASVYSASELARDELPDLDVSIRGAVSIARRLQDPLAELVKIDPKSIGVGQYQHDVSQPRLKQRLDEVVESCVNRVGVEVNTASAPLLSYVAGIGPTLAANIVKTRDAHGGFRSRADLAEVPRSGAKAFEQAARISSRTRRWESTRCVGRAPGALFARGAHGGATWAFRSDRSSANDGELQAHQARAVRRRRRRTADAARTFSRS